MEWIAMILAGFTVLIHLCFVVFVVFGGMIGFYRIRWLWLHSPCFVWGVLLSVFHWPCPLTPLEKWFRQYAGLESYSGSFIEHYLFPLLYPPWMTPLIQQWMGWGLLVLNLVIYGLVFYREKS